MSQLVELKISPKDNPKARQILILEIQPLLLKKLATQCALGSMNVPNNANRNV
jgi:hypothetical protein